MSFLTAKEFADMLSVPVSAVYSLVKNGEIGVVKVGKTYRFDSDVVNAFIKNGGSSAKLVGIQTESEDQPDLGNPKKVSVPVNEKPSVGIQNESHKPSHTPSIVLKKEEPKPEPKPEPPVEVIHQKTIIIREMWDAAILDACGHRIMDLEFSISLNRLLFHFEDCENLRLDLEDHRTGRLTLSTRDLLNSWMKCRKLFNLHKH